MHHSSPSRSDSLQIVPPPSTRCGGGTSGRAGRAGAPRRAAHRRGRPLWTVGKNRTSVSVRMQQESARPG
ncbi:Cyclopropane-fatty-acyl-phospholipid synthase (plasmid) [Ralstonia solanacearum]|nr:Cyclopropane-fatty-acyl-phospholipid synthase [Ralstonia solanacearum]